ncbi:MAG: hypothetical protein K8J31_01300 [Anaerolineae bacterium]|nr:hypothetical protein [Anaerolineae bacterium]
MDASQIENTVPNRSTELITVMKDAQPASPLEIDAFLKLLAIIAKRIITEESSANERKVS